MAAPTPEILWWNELNKDSPDLDKLTDYALHVDINNSNEDNEYPLFIAVRKNNIPLLKKLIELNADVDIQDGDDNTALITAAKNGYPDIVKLLLDAGAEIEIQGEYANTALFSAIEYGYPNIVKLLLDADADVNHLDENDNTALMTAAEHGETESVKFLLAAGAGVNVQGDYGRTALINAAENGESEIVKLLLDAGADVNIQTDGNHTALIIATKNSGYPDIVKLLLAAGADVNVTDEYGDTALIMSCEGGNIEIVQLLLDAGADVNIKNDNDDTALIIAYIYPEIIKLLLGAGADVNVSDEYGNTILIESADKGYTEIIKLLLDAGVDVNIQNYNGDTALITASEKGNTEIVKLLLDAGVDVNIQNYNGDTALITASEKGNTEIVKLLLDAGADKTIKNKKGQTAFDLAKNAEIQNLLDPSPPWTGFSRSDIAFTNEIFHQHIHPNTLFVNFKDKSLFSMCPICLRYVEHESKTCMYMTHSCVEDGGYNHYYHHKLWDAFKYTKTIYNHLGNIIGTKTVVAWCTLCGRICKDHSHYELDQLYTSDGAVKIPHLIQSIGGPYEIDCSKHRIGGGGLLEKVNRYRRFREVVLVLNKPKYIGKLTFRKALDLLVEEVWKSASAPRNFEMQDILNEKMYNEPVANAKFPMPATENNVVENIPYPNTGNPDLLPVVYPTATTTRKNAAEEHTGDTENIIQFRHRMADGSINEHHDSYQQIALDTLMNQIRSMLDNPTGYATFGMCWQQLPGIQSMLPASAKESLCTARLYPEELLHAVHQAVLDEAQKDEYIKLCNSYRIVFNKKFKRINNGQNGGKRTRKHRR